MNSFSIERLSSWLRCPVCTADLAPVDRLTLGCAQGHRHDVNKRGYVSLLGGGSTLSGDSAAMLDAREAVLSSGAYAALTAAVANAAEGGRIVDAGTGTGHYLRTALDALPGSSGLGIDLSPAAAARTARSDERVDALVADIWRPLPVREATADSVLDVFAPRNLSEFHRVLRPAGTLVVAVPRPEHLAELQGEGGMLEVPDDKVDSVLARAGSLFVCTSREHIRATLPLDAALSAALRLMGPAAHHSSHTAPPTPPIQAATLSVDVLRLVRC